MISEETSAEKLLDPNEEVRRRANGAELNKVETYTVEDAIEKMGFGAFQAKMAAIVGFAYVSIHSLSTFSSFLIKLRFDHYRLRWVTMLK